MKFCRKVCSLLLAAALCATPVSALTLPTPPVTGSSLAKPASTPGGTLELALDALKTLDVPAFNRYTDNVRRQDGSDGSVRGSHNVMLWGDGDSVTEQEKAWATELFRNLSWTVGDVKTSGGTATVSVKITNSDLRGQVKDMTVKALKDAPGENDTEAWEKEMIDAIRAAQKATVTNEVTATVNKVAGSWKVHLDDALVNAMLGGMLDGVKNLFSDGTMEAILGAAITKGLQGAANANDWLGVSAGEPALDDSLLGEIEKAIDEANREALRAIREADIAGEIERALQEAFQ